MKRDKKQAIDDEREPVAQRKLAETVLELNGRWTAASEAQRAAHVRRLTSLARLDPHAAALTAAVGEARRLGGEGRDARKRPAIRRRNLIFFLLPLKNPERVWQWHVERLRRRLQLFNGRRIVTVATPNEDSLCALDAVEEVKTAFGADAKRIEFSERPNDAELWEGRAFQEMLSQVESTADDEATFYFHAKGVRRLDQRAVRPWCEKIYRWNLDKSAAALAALRTHDACGVALRQGDPTGRDPGGWHFAGTGFWFRHDAIFAGDWRSSQRHSHAVEAWLSRRLLRSEARCLAHEGIGDPYDPATWRKPANDSPRISILVAARDYGRYLRDCLESCLWQTRPAHEVIYCDDASNDDSLAVAKTFAAVKLLRLKKRHGVVAARNASAAKATGDALLFVDGDNILPRDYLAKMAAALDYSTPFAYGDLAFFGEEAAYHRQPEWREFDLWQTNFCDTCSLVWRWAFEAAGGWIGGPWTHMEDHHLFLRLSCFGAARRAETALGYRKHGSSSTAEFVRRRGEREISAAVERIRNDAMRWAVERFGRLPTRAERDLGVLIAGKRELR